ncbi:MAG TPA: SHOCT domain-containing protein [Ignavibacteria bacterium]
MKKVVLILILSIFTSFVLAGVSFAAEMQLKSVDTILTEIRAEQGISSSDKIDATKVSQATLEELGDSVMEAMIGNTAMHDQMDVRLGGDGSESLKAFHINIGINYLTDYPNGMMNIMSGGMMGNNSTIVGGWNDDNISRNNNSGTDSRWNISGMMGYLAYAGIAAGFFLLLLIVIIVLIVFGILRSKKITAAHDTTSEILARRVANGEITKEEFDRMTKNIRS